MLVQLVNDHGGHAVPFEVEHNAGAFFVVGLVIYMGYAFDRSVVNQLPDAVC